MSVPVDRYTLARSSPAGFAWAVSDGAWILAPHLRLLSEKIVEVATGRCPRLIVTMPPRHGKSELISRFTPAWFLGNFPDKKVMLASYADTFAAQWGRKSRELLEEFGPQIFGVRVSSDVKGGQQWELQSKKGGKRASGVMVTAGVGGGLTGKGAHLMIIDDPVKNSEEAQSERIRDAHHDWWKSTARTRLQKGSGVILVMTRWHEDDLAGRLLADEVEGGDKWEILNLPGLCEDPTTDALGRKKGEPLWPEMFDLDWMKQTERAMGSYWFSAMYQQRPAPADGMLFKRSNFRYWQRTEDPNIVRVFPEGRPSYVFDINYGTRFQTVDVAASSKEEADYTVVATWHTTVEGDLLLWDLQRRKYDGPEVLNFVRAQADQHQPRIIGVERLGYGLTVIQQLVREGYPIIRLEPDKDKVSRALPAAARYEEHKIFHPKGPAWVDDLESELLVFPNGKNDDQVDVVAYAALQMPNLMSGVYQSRVRTGANRWSQSSKGSTFTGGLLSQSW